MADTSFVKPDPDTKSPAPVEDDDLYEDAGDLEFYDKNAVNRETLYLARIPKYMWDAWMKMTDRLGDNDEIQIGTLRTWNEEKPDGTVVCYFPQDSPLNCQSNSGVDQAPYASRFEMPRAPTPTPRIRP